MWKWKIKKTNKPLATEPRLGYTMDMEDTDWLEEALNLLVFEWAKDAMDRAEDPRDIVDSDYNQEWCPEFGEDYHD